MLTILTLILLLFYCENTAELEKKNRKYKELLIFCEVWKVTTVCKRFHLAVSKI